MRTKKSKLLYITAAFCMLIALTLISCGRKKSDKSATEAYNGNNTAKSIPYSQTDSGNAASDKSGIDSDIKSGTADSKAAQPPQTQKDLSDTSDAKPRTNSEAEPEAKSESKPDTMPEAEPEAKSDANPDAEPEADKAKTEAGRTKPEAKSKAEPEADKDEPKAHHKTNSDSEKDKSDIGSDVTDKKHKTETALSESKSDSSDNPEDSTDKNKNKAKRIVAIDAGHQRKGNYEQEPIGPGAKETKAKVSSGTQGSYTKVPEYELNLTVAKKVRDELINRGYEVVMIRESNDVNLSNKERADIANDSGADIFIRIHADGSTNSSVNGTSTLYPSKKNPYVADLSDASFKLSKSIVDAICKNTGSKNRGAIAHDDMSGINWSKIPVTIIEMGYMTNEKEDKLMQTEDYQDKIVKGICDGIDDYFKE